MKKPEGCDPCSWPQCGCQFSPAPAKAGDETLIRQLRQIATEFAIDNKTDLKQHVCWIAADRIANLLAPFSPAAEGMLFLASELEAFHDCADGDVQAGNGHFRLECISESEQQRLNLRAVLRDAAKALRLVVTPVKADGPISAEECFRGTLRVIAHWAEVDLSGEWETGLRGIIRSMTDAAREALSAYPSSALSSKDSQ